MTRALAVLAAGALVASCASGPPPGAGPPSSLPPIPEVRGDPRLYVAYPDAGDRITASDSNFVFGTTGTGAAELTVNGRRVPVEPNGAFLAWLPVPPRAAGDTARYRLVARAGDRADSLVHPIRLPPRPYEGEGSVWVDTAALTRLAERWGPPEEVLERTVRAAPGLDAWVEVRAARRGRAAGDASSERAGAVRVPLEEESPGRYRLRVPLGRLAGRRPRAGETGSGGAGRASGADAGAADAASDRSTETGPPDGSALDTLRLVLRATDGRDTASRAGELPLRLLEPGRLPLATVVEEPHPVHGRAGRVAARPSPNGSYAWLLAPGSSAPVDRRRGDRVRLRLQADLHAWVAAEDLVVGPPRRLPAGRPAPVADVGIVRAEPGDGRIRIRVRVGRRLPAHAEPAGRRSLRLVVEGGLGATDRMVYGSEDPLLRGLRWRQQPGPRWVLTVRLSEPLWGWNLRWSDVEAREGAPRFPGGFGDPTAEPARSGPAVARRSPDPADPGTLVLDVRRPPEIDAGNPLRGIRVAVDPGHPPVGAEGPTGLTEDRANLGVARQLEELLIRAGAEPILVREDSSAVGLYERRRRAVAAGADLLVSIHNNALPDGVRPFGREGTSTYYFHSHARPLARRVQRGLLESLGLDDRGVRWGNLALPRESWMPAVLTEGAFMMFPRHEAALRTRAFRAAYARGVLRGIRAFLAEHASRAGRAGDR